MKKKSYRITLSEKSNAITESMALTACKSNGKEDNGRITLQELKGVFKAKAFEWPATAKDMNCEIIGDYVLSIDMKDGDKYVNVLYIEEVEINELSEPEEIPPYSNFKERNECLQY